MIDTIKSKIYRLLRWSERYTKTDMIYLTKGGFWLSFMQVTSSLSAFLLSIIFANFLTKEVYGLYKYILSIFSILSIFTLSGMNVATTRAYSMGQKGVIISALKEKIKFGLVGSLLALGLSLFYFFQGDSTLAQSLLISAIFLPLLDSFNIYETFYYGKKDFRTPNIYLVINQIIAFLFMAGAAVWASENVLIIVSAYFIPWVVGRMIMTKITLKKEGSVLLNSVDHQDTLNYGKHLTLLNSIGTVANFLDKIIIFNAIGPSVLAIYSIAVAPIDQVKSLLSKSVISLSLPKYAEKSKEEVRRHALVWSLKIIAVTVPMILLYVSVSDWLFNKLFPQYLESVFFTNIYALTLLSIPIYLFQTALNSLGSKKALYVASVSSSATQIILIFIGGLYFGLTGIVSAVLISRLVQMAIFAVAIQKA